MPRADGFQRFIHPRLLHFTLVIQNILRNVLELQGAEAVSHSRSHSKKRQADSSHRGFFQTIATSNGLLIKFLRFHRLIL